MSTVYYELRVLRLEGLRWTDRFHRKVPSLYVEIKLGDITHKTDPVKKNSAPVWNETFDLSSSDESEVLQIKVKHSSRLPSDPTVGFLEIGFVDILERCSNGEADFEIQASSRQSSAAVGSIVLDVKRKDLMAAAGDAIGAAEDDVRQQGITKSEGIADKMQFVSDGIALASNQGDLYHAVGDLLSKLQGFKEFVDTISGVHPYLTIAWTAASALFTAAKSVYDKDKRILGLVHTMNDAFSFVRDVEILRDKIGSLQESIEALLKQTIECCFFVRHYASRGFIQRGVDIKASETIGKFEQALVRLKNNINTGVGLHTAFVSSRAAQKIDELWLHQRLIPSSFEAGDRPRCLPGTRKGIIDEVVKWVSSETDQNIFWLCGVAGSGKSTVSTTIAEYFRGVSRLGAFLFFERGKSDPLSVIRTIAYKLALFDSSIGSSIASAIENDKDIASAPLDHQFKTLLEPLCTGEESIPGPIVVVLDAFDECGTPEKRRRLLELLWRRFDKLSNVFRSLITSRQELDIDEVLSSHPMHVRAAELDYHSATSRHDVHTFLCTEMDNADRRVEVPVDWPWDSNMVVLGDAASGLFIWASTAVKTVRESGDPFYQLNVLVKDSKSLSGFGLDDLYASVLRNSGIKWEDERLKDRFKMILGLILFGKVPLSIKAIDGILGWEPHETSGLVLSTLRSLVAYIPGGTVSLFHTSFSDYLLSPERESNPWRIDILAAKLFIAERCFSVMGKLLRFNICNLNSSFVRNDDVSGLADRVKERIPSHLEYACLHWSQHLLEITYSTGVIDMLLEFACQRLLFWFEVLSLVKEFHRTASRALLDAAKWSEPHVADIASFLRDASGLASTFATAIVASAPHVYTSMIPLMTDASQVAEHYAKSFSSTVHVERRGTRRAPMYLKTLDGHSGIVRCVAFSPNGQWIASASHDGKVRIWDIESGAVICILAGHSALAMSIGFSPDGKRIVSGSGDGTLRIWDGENGDLLLGPLKGHKGGVYSVVFSPSRNRIASGSSDNTIIVWDAADGKTVTAPFTGHTDAVYSVAFSFDGTRLISGSKDKTIIIWDVESGKPVLDPLKGHSGMVCSVDFSPNGEHVVSGSADRTVKIWEVATGNVISSLVGQSSLVTSVAYSPCGTHIVSGSVDNTIMIWDAKSGQVASGPFKGHSHVVYSVAWSRDGRYIASGSDDKTVRIWDATARVKETEQFSGHTARVRCVAYSPDASRIASASSDKSIIVWDAKNGDVVLGPILGHSSDVLCVAYSLDGSRLISGSLDKTVRIWNAETGATISDPLEGHTSSIWCIALSPDGSKFASGSSDKTIRVWDLETGTLVACPLYGHSDSILSLAFSSDGKLLASGSDDKTIMLWDTETWECVYEPLTGHTDEINSVCFSPDGTRMASGSVDATIIIWDVKSRQMVGIPLMGHAYSVRSVIFSIDGRHVISGSADGTIRIWDVESGNVCKILEGHKSLVMSLALSPDGSRLASSSVDNTIRTWDILRLPNERDDGLALISPHRNDDLVDWVLGDSGWIIPGHGRRELLLWIPPDLRTTLWRPRNTGVFSCEFSTGLDFTGVALGERWTECFAPRLSDG